MNLDDALPALVRQWPDLTIGHHFGTWTLTAAGTRLLAQGPDLRACVDQAWHAPLTPAPDDESLETEQEPVADLTDEQLSAVGLEPMGSSGQDGVRLYEDVGRQEISHVLSGPEAQAVARRRLGLPRLRQHMTRDELLVEFERVIQERHELRQSGRADRQDDPPEGLDLETGLMAVGETWTEADQDGDAVLRGLAAEEKVSSVGDPPASDWMPCQFPACMHPEAPGEYNHVHSDESWRLARELTALTAQLQAWQDGHPPSIRQGPRLADQAGEQAQGRADEWPGRLVGLDDHSARAVDGRRREQVVSHRVQEDESERGPQAGRNADLVQEIRSLVRSRGEVSVRQWANQAQALLEVLLDVRLGEEKA